MTQIYLYIIVAFIIGFILAWIIRTIAMEKIKKVLKSTQGYLESETLKKETLQKENLQVYQMKQIVEIESVKKLLKAQEINKLQDSDILLLQKSNEETEALLEQGLPAMHTLKMQLIEANNTIARFKAQQQLTKK